MTYYTMDELAHLIDQMNCDCIYGIIPLVEHSNYYDINSEKIVMY